MINGFHNFAHAQKYGKLPLLTGKIIIVLILRRYIFKQTKNIISLGFSYEKLKVQVE